MTGKSSIIGLLVTLGCANEKSVSPPGNQAPEATISRPFVGELIRNGAFYVASGQVTDPDNDPEELMVSWSMGSEERCAPMAPDSEGNTTCDVSFGWDRTSITLSVVDPDGAEGAITVEIELEEAEAPQVAITSPEDGAEFRTNELIEFTATVSDGEDRPEGLGLVWESDLQGLLDLSHTVSSDGDVAGSVRLEPGNHLIRLRVTDTSGRASEDQVVIDVYPESAAPSATISSPAAGSSFGPGDLVVFTAEISDERDPAELLDVAWSSNADGPLGGSPSDSSGNTVLSTDSLSEGSHLITLTVTDSEGMTGTAIVDIIIGESAGDEGPAPDEDTGTAEDTGS